MAENKKYFHNIDLVRNKLMNPLLNPMSTSARLALSLSVADQGYVCYDTTDNKQYFWDGAHWVASGGGGPIYPTSLIPYGDGTTPGGITSSLFNYDPTDHFYAQVNNNAGLYLTISSSGLYSQNTTATDYSYTEFTPNSSDTGVNINTSGIIDVTTIVQAYADRLLEFTANNDFFNGDPAQGIGKSFDMTYTDKTGDTYTVHYDEGENVSDFTNGDQPYTVVSATYGDINGSGFSKNMELLLYESLVDNPKLAFKTNIYNGDYGLFSIQPELNVITIGDISHQVHGTYIKVDDRFETIKASKIIDAPGFRTIGGTSSQFVKGDGSLDTHTYLTTISGLNISLLNNDSGYITSSALSPYLTSATAASTYYPLTNPSGYITSSALSPYLTISSAASTYEPKITAGTTGQYWSGNKTWQTLPVYTLAGLGGVPTTRQLTINGTTYDLSADRTWTIPTYSLPIASDTILGGIKVGSGLSIDSGGVLSLNNVAGVYYGYSFNSTIFDTYPNSITGRYLYSNRSYIVNSDYSPGSTGTIMFMGLGDISGNTYGSLDVRGGGGLSVLNLAIGASSGNILLGSITDNGTGAKVQVTGTITANAFKTIGGSTTQYIDGTGGLQTFSSGITTALGYTPSRAINIQKITGNTVLSLSSSVNTILVNGSIGSTINVTVPLASTAYTSGFYYTIKNIGGGSINILPTSTDLIDGQSSISISSSTKTSLTLAPFNDGSWYLI